MSLRRVITNDEADLMVLNRANVKGKFGIPVNGPMPTELQFAFERGIDNDWFRLVDVAAIAAMPSITLRLFKLTDAGIARRTALRTALRAA